MTNRLASGPAQPLNVLYQQYNIAPCYEYRINTTMVAVFLISYTYTSMILNGYIISSLESFTV